MNATDAVLYLCICAVKGTVPEKKIIDGMDLEAVYNEASRHMITAMAGMALRDAGAENQKFKKAVAAAQRKTVILNRERERVCRELNSACIWHVALKGSVLKDWYPKFGMRESVDVDILFDKACSAQVKDLMTSLGYTVKNHGRGHHDVYIKKPLSCFEMHQELFCPADSRTMYDYFCHVKDRLVLKRESEYQFTPEDFYIYFIAHEYRHYSRGGTGIRSLLDTYVTLNHLDLNWDYVTAECEKLGLKEFEEKNRLLAAHLFADSLTAEDRERLGYFISSGTYGTLEQKVKNRVAASGSKLSYIWHRLYLPLYVVKSYYPMFYKHRLLLPFLPFYRLYKGMRRGSAAAEIKQIIRE